MSFRTKVLIYLLLLAGVDTIIPIPFTTILFIYVFFEKPDWFSNLVKRIYHDIDL